MSNWLLNIVDEYFGFVRTEFNFNGPYEYNIGPEMGCYYTDGRLVLYIGYDSFYYVEIKKFKNEIEDLRTGHLHLREIGYKYLSHDLLVLMSDNKTFYSKYPSSDDQIKVYLKILKENIEILKGDFRKFSIRYRIMNKLKKSLREY